MTVKQRLNDVLERATGRRFMQPNYTKVGDLGDEVEAEARAVLNRVAGRTLGVPLQQYTTWSAVRYLVQNHIDGAIVECGTWRGGQAMIAALTLMQVGDTSRDIYLFDTFEGMPPPSDRDTRLDDGMHADQMLELSLGDRTSSENAWCIADQRDVASGMASTNYPAEHVHLVAGLVEDTIPSEAPPRIALLRLDTDWYESTRHELEHLWDRVVPNGVVVIDDYDFWAGSRGAVDEFLAARNVWPMLFRPGVGRALLKPVAQPALVNQERAIEIRGRFRRRARAPRSMASRSPSG